MRAVVVYESMYGNTHEVAEAIAVGLGESCDAVAIAANRATAEAIADSSLVVVGGPTHAHGMSRPTTRASAVNQAADLEMDPDAAGDGVREWLTSVAPAAGRRGAAFDTRVDMSPVLTGRASKGIAKALGHHGYELIAEPESFLVDKHTELEHGEAARATEWGRHLAARLHELWAE